MSQLKRKSHGYFSPLQMISRIALLSCLALMCSGCGWLAFEDERAVLDMQVVQVGQKVTVLIPGDTLFYGKTGNFKPQAFDMLESLTGYLKSHHVNRFKVIGYVDNMTNSTDNDLVSKKQAEALMTYLWKHLDGVVWSRFEGQGARNPLTEAKEGVAQGRNRRLTVAFFESSY